ncbi:MAG: phosphatase PAP2 family protein, partial [Daejeonella sp.]
VLILLFGIVKKNTDFKVKGWQLVLALICNSVVVNILKYSIHRERPFVNNHFIEKLSTGGSPSFPSGHTADAFLIAVSVSLLFTRQKWWLLLVWLWALAVAYSRIVLGVHYPSDVLGSLFIGTAIAIIVHNYFKKIKANDDAAMVKRN